MRFTKSDVRSEAIEEYKESIRIRPNTASGHLGLEMFITTPGNTHWRSAPTEKEFASMQNNVDAHYNLGLSYFGLNNRNAALEEYRILQRLDPDKATKLFNVINR